MWGEKGYGDGSIPYMWLSSIALLPWLPGISHKYLLPHIPSICLSAINSSPHSGIAPQSHKLQFSWSSETAAPSYCVFQGTSVPDWGMYGYGKDCLILILFRLPQISCFTLSLKCFSSDSDNCPDVGLVPMFKFPYPLRAGPVLLTLLFFPLVPLSYRVLRDSIYSFPTGQVLLSALSWCSECTSVSEGVFLMYPWREIYSMYTYSSTILFFNAWVILKTIGPGKEWKASTNWRIWEKSKGERKRQPIYPTNLPGSFSLESIFAEQCTRHKEGSWVRMFGQRQPRN